MGLVLTKTAEYMASGAIGNRRKNLESIAKNLSAAYVWSRICENGTDAAAIDRLGLKVRARLKAHYRADSAVFADADGKVKEDAEYGPTSDYSVETLVAALNEYRDALAVELAAMSGDGDVVSFEVKHAEIDEVESLIAIYSDERAARLAYGLLEKPEARVQWQGDPDVIEERPTLYERLKGVGQFSPVKIESEKPDEEPYAEGGLHLKTAAEFIDDVDNSDEVF